MRISQDHFLNVELGEKWVNFLNEIGWVFLETVLTDLEYIFFITVAVRYKTS